MSNQSQTTLIKAGIVIAFQDGEHRVLHDGVVVITGNEVVHVGKTWSGTPDTVINAQDQVVTPGFITTHLHAAESPLDKSWIEDVGNRLFSYSGLSEMLPARSGAIPEGAAKTCAEYSMIELLKTGVTTIMEQGGAPHEVAEAAEQVGIRAYIASGFKSGKWITYDGKKMDYEWFEDGGAALFEQALSFIEHLESKQNPLLQGFLAPSQVDTISQDLLKEAKAVSDDKDLPITLHTSQSVFEFDEMIQRHGLTPIEWLESINFLGKNTLLGHAIYTSGNSWVQMKGDDLRILGETNTSVAHSPWVFARRGIVMESFPHYEDAGINMTLGTDTAPQSMIEALRLTAVLGKVTARDTTRATAGDVFNAATVNAADYLGRKDLGRICAGAKADLLFWKLDSLFMAPVRDVIKNIVFSATPQELTSVMVDGKFVVENHVVQSTDEQRVINELQQHAEVMWANIPEHDWANRTADEMSPQTFPEYQS